MPTNSKAERKYFEHYAEPEARLADRLDGYGHAVAVPAYGEGDELVGMLRSVPPGPRGSVLVVLVVNGKASAPGWVHERNGSVVGRLRRAFGERGEETLSRDPPARLLEFQAGRILCVDRSDPRHWFPDDQGVGLARKVAVDVATRLHARGRLVSPFIHSTDADVELPADYFERAETGHVPLAAALVYPFEHRPDDDPGLARAVLLYEISLRYYVLGLAFAGSPSAYHTIGSTIATHAGAYAKVRGFPKRDAAEDFYVLSKLAKVGAVVSLRGNPISIRGRASGRVPFGTGAAVTRIAALGSRPFTMYDPRLFRYLRAWLAGSSRIELGESDRTVDRHVREACANDGLDPEPLLDALRVLGVAGAIASARLRSKTTDALERHLGTWFDAFRTLKLVHVLQRGGMVQKPWYEALCEAPFTREALGDISSRDVDMGALCDLSRRLASLEPAARAALAR